MAWALVERARADADATAPSGSKQPGNALADRAGGGEDGHGDARERPARSPLVGREDRGGGRGVRAVGIEQDGDGNGPKNVDLDGLEDLFAARDVRAADEDRRVLQVGRTSREEAAVDQLADVLGRDAAVSEQVVDPGIDGDDGVEDAGLRVGVELEEDRGLHRACGSLRDADEGGRRAAIGIARRSEAALPGSARRTGAWPYPSGRGLPAAVGWPFMARSMESLVAS